MIIIIAKILCLCISVAGIETLQGILRNKFIVPKIGYKKASQLSLLTGMIFAFIVCLVIVPWLGVYSVLGLITVGIVLSTFMVIYDIILARLIGQKWNVILNSFNIAKGNYLLIGVVILIFLPYLSKVVSYMRYID